MPPAVAAAAAATAVVPHLVLHLLLVLLKVVLLLHETLPKDPGTCQEVKASSESCQARNRWVSTRTNRSLDGHKLHPFFDADNQQNRDKTPTSLTQPPHSCKEEAGTRSHSQFYHVSKAHALSHGRTKTYEHGRRGLARKSSSEGHVATE